MMMTSARFVLSSRTQAFETESLKTKVSRELLRQASSSASRVLLNEASGESLRFPSMMENAPSVLSLSLSYALG